jgi:NadR type nicotinamide-nucleotide adenylyltransferase
MSEREGIRKIVIIGPESTGKTTLAEELAAYYKTSWCPEFARTYLLEKGTDYTYEDLLDIARAQVELEDRLLPEAKNGLFFIDTDMYVMKVWCEVVFEQCHTWILKQIAERKYDFYLLCNTELPWVEDELREYPDLAIRQKLFHMYKDIVINSGVPWSEIGGTHEQRIHSAISIVDNLIAKSR